ncbi:Uncharacterised protein [Salmonella enterica subsp. enterica serovar Braenderup]|nr:hypothetical protein [Salmonella enterica subsp. enterica serovar Braenderup]SUH57016.1 Uncharacterised protein [Salmonella enterica subsp. enterica serovar Braenderup]
MEMIFRNIPLARSGHSDKRGDLSVGILCMIPAHSYSKAAQVHYKNTIIGVVKNLTFADLHNGVAELRGDIVLYCSYSTIAEMAFDEVYPSISVSATPNNKGGDNPYLARLSLVNREEREFEDQQPLDLSDLRNLINSATKSEAPAEPQGDKPYIYAPGMNSDDLTNWLNSVISDLNTSYDRKEILRSLEERRKKIKAEIDECEAFLSKTIRV